jgi:hypothetical protein
MSFFGKLTAAGVVNSLRKIYLTVQVTDLTASSALVYGVPVPAAGTVTKIWSRLNAALTTGNATLTGKIGSSAITNGVVTITQAGSAAGDIDSATPTAAHAVVAGDNLTVTVGGTNTGGVRADVVFEITLS